MDSLLSESILNGIKGLILSIGALHTQQAFSELHNTGA